MPTEGNSVMKDHCSQTLSFTLKDTKTVFKWRIFTFGMNGFVNLSTMFFIKVFTKCVLRLFILGVNVFYVYAQCPIYITIIGVNPGGWGVSWGWRCHDPPDLGWGIVGVAGRVVGS